MTHPTITDEQAAAIVQSLVIGQVSTIKGLSVTPCVLGFAEQTAIRLTKANTTRPALVAEGLKEATYGYRQFGLTADGVVVQKALAA